jgi:hypothetical protein
LLEPFDPCDQDRLGIVHDVIVGDHVAERRDHKAAAGSNLDAIQIDGSFRTELLDLGVNAADDPDEDCCIGRRLRALSERRHRHQQARRPERCGFHDPRPSHIHAGHQCGEALPHCHSQGKRYIVQPRV